ncbi:hypothetical protein K227x_53220 [Rubripirellula lacrimiformis]|uniref:Uncharacterized protein n=1 Tax=Rubripirellula lacrimiformis TaxID=1930273 RepID=A0A517NID7_9BACT|nr:hypothetical protein [Rubripirellula lacrimiformis]QDT06899.1 hypothetical protein K227x_53220 [Rubripirellula lacrimiformis]
MSQSKVKAGEGYVEIGLRNRIAQGAAGVQADLEKLSKNATALGAKIAAGSAALLAFPIKSASEMQETVGKFEVVFGEAAGSVREWSDTTAKAMGQSKQSMADMLASMQDLLVPMGVMPQTAAGMSKTLSALAVDLGSFNNMGTAQVFENLMSAITGEGQVMKKYGVILTETATKQELFNMGLDPDTTDNAAKAKARLNIIMRGTTAAQGDAIRTASSFENQMKALWAAVVDASGAIGGAFLDDTAALVTMARDAVQLIADFVTKNQDLVRTIGLATIAVGGLGVGLVATGFAASAMVSTLGTAMTAIKVAAGGATIAWAGVGLLFTAVTLKARITAAVVTAGWKVASVAVSAAWTVAMGVIGTAFKAVTAAAMVTAVATPWVAGAAAIAVAYFGLDVIMSALATGVAAVWSASAGTVTAAWSASAAFLMPIAAAISGAWSASAAFIATAWGGLSAVFAASGLAASTSALLATAAWSAFGAISAILAVEQSASAAIVAIAWTTASFVSSTAWSGFMALLTAALTPASLMAGAALLVSGSWTVAAGLVSLAWGTAWAVISGPLLPFIAAAGAAIAVVGTLAAGIGVLAVKSLNLGGAFAKAKDMIYGIVSVVTDTFDAIKAAISSGDYAAAAQALWAGVRLAFWEGVSGTMDAFSWLWREAKLTAARFFTALLVNTQRVMSAVVTSITSPFKAAKEIQSAMLALGASATSFDVDGRANAAREELKAIRDRLTAENESTEAKKKSQAEAKKEADAASELFDTKIKALEAEILALEKGETAADRKRLADEGLNAIQIKQIEAMKAKKKALEDEETAQKKATKAAEDAANKASDKRADAVFKRADQMSKDGMNPADIFRKVIAQINSDEQAGRINGGDAADARDRARDNLDDRTEAIRQEGKALAESLRTPAENLRAKMADIEKFKSAGVFGDNMADRAKAKAREEFAEEEARNRKRAKKVELGFEKEQKRTGPSGAFSAAAAGVIGMGRQEDEKTKLTRIIAGNSTEQVKLARKKNTARFG